MKIWKLFTGAVLVLAGFCAGMLLNFPPIGAIVHGASDNSQPALKTVVHDSTLAGAGTDAAPLGIANGGVSAPKLSASATPSPGQVLGFNGSNLAWQNVPVGGLRVVDNAGNLVGPAQTASQVLRQIGQFTFVLYVGPSGFHNSGSFSFYHTTTDCTGPRYLQDDGTLFFRRSSNTSTQVFFPADPVQQITMNSEETIVPPADPNLPVPCFGPVTPVKGVFGLATSLDLSTLNLTPPFHLEF
jgi:hypothetical protein